MNVYDEANNLAKAIKECAQVKRYEDAITKVSQNVTYQQMVRDFMKSQFEMSKMQMQGVEIPQEKTDAFNALYKTVSGVGEVSEFIQSQISYAVMMQDVSKIISDASDVEIPFMKDDIDEMMANKDK